MSERDCCLCLCLCFCQMLFLLISFQYTNYNTNYTKSTGENSNENVATISRTTTMSYVLGRVDPGKFIAFDCNRSHRSINDRRFVFRSISEILLHFLWGVGHNRPWGGNPLDENSLLERNLRHEINKLIPSSRPLKPIHTLFDQHSLADQYNECHM